MKAVPRFRCDRLGHTLSLPPVECPVAGRKVARTEPEVQAWLEDQGYALEHEVSKAFKRAGFLPRIARPYRDPVEGKVRELDVLARPGFNNINAKRDIRLLFAAECKSRTTGAWLVRTTSMFRVGTPDWWPICSPELTSYFKEVGAIFTGPGPAFSDPVGFSVVEAAPNEGEANGAYKAISQAVSAAVAIATEQPRPVPLIVHPIVVVDAPLFTVNYDDDPPARVAPATFYRVLWSSPLLERSTAVDLTTRDNLVDNLLAIRESFQDYCIEETKQPAPFGAAV